MTTIILVLALAAVLFGLVGLVAYARHDHFAGGGNRTSARDDLGYADPARLAF